MLASKLKSPVKEAIKLNAVFSFVIMLFAGILLDGGLLGRQLLVGILMFWASLALLWIIRRHNRRMVTKYELISLRLSLPLFILVAVILNVILSKLDHAPLWMPILTAIRG